MQTPGSVKRMAERDTLLFKDCCQLISPVSTTSSLMASFAASDCESFGLQIMQHGADSALSEYVRTILNFLVYLNNYSSPQNSNFTLVNETLNSDTLSFISDMSDKYLFAATDLGSIEYNNENTALGSASAVTTDILFICMLLCIVILYFTVYHPLIRTLDTQLKRTRGMLLMIPEDVIENIPTIRRMILESKL